MPIEPSPLTKMTAQQRSALRAKHDAETKAANKRRQQAELVREIMSAEHEQANFKANFKGGKVPVHLGDLRGPAGNVHFIIGACQNSISQLEQAGIPVSDEARDVIANFRKRTYDATLDLILDYFDDLDGSIEALRENREDDPF